MPRKYVHVKASGGPYAYCRLFIFNYNNIYLFHSCFTPDLLPKVIGLYRRSFYPSLRGLKNPSFKAGKSWCPFNATYCQKFHAVLQSYCPALFLMPRPFTSSRLANYNNKNKSYPLCR
jgi:hypothetical protein